MSQRDNDHEQELVEQAAGLRSEVRLFAEALNRAAAGADPESVARLTAQVHTFSDTVALVATKAAAAERLNRRYRLLAKVLTGVVVAVTTLGCVAIYNAARIANIQERTSNEVLCPVLALSVNSYQPDLVPEGQRDRYAQAYEVMLHAYRTLDCG